TDITVFIDEVDNYTPALLNGVRQFITITAATSKNLTIPASGDEDFPEATEIFIEQGGAGAVTIVPGSGVTIESADSVLSTTTQYQVLVLLKKDTDLWVVTGVPLSSGGGGGSAGPSEVQTEAGDYDIADADEGKYIR